MCFGPRIQARCDLYCIRLKTFGSPKKGGDLAIFGQIWLNFGLKMFIFGLGRTVPIKPSTVNLLLG